MGSKKQFLVQSLKRAAALASVLGIVGGIYVGSASAQTARYQPLHRLAQPAPTVQGSGARLLPRNYLPIPRRNSVRGLSAEPMSMPHATQPATGMRAPVIGQQRMIPAGYPQGPTAIGGLPQGSDSSMLQRDDDKIQDIFDQPIPSFPRTDDNPRGLDTQNADPQRQNGNELPPEMFQDPFKDERRVKPDKRSVEIPGQVTPAPTDPPSDADNPLEDPLQPGPNPFEPEQEPEDPIDYQPGRGFNPTRKRSNVYKSPESTDVLEQRDKGVYFVPAYDPIPGTQPSTLAPPAAMHPQYDPAWQGQYANPNQQFQYGQPPSPQPQYGQPQLGYPQYGQPQYQQPYGQPQYQQPPNPYAQPPGFQPAPAVHPEQQVYTPVVQPPTNSTFARGPMTTVRRGLLGKMTQNLKKDLGFGDYQSCQDAGSCGGCENDCNSSCPVFYFGFQAAYNDAFDVSNRQGSELVLDDGTAFYFSLGRMNGRNLRTEVELSFRSNDVSSLLTSDGELPFTGQLQTFSGMANAYWEFVNSPTGRFKPYIGGGVGFLSATTDIRLASDPTQADDQADSSSSFAYQWIAGVNFKVSNHMDLFGEYRFTEANSFGIASDREDLSGDFRYKANSVGGGLRWKF